MLLFRFQTPNQSGGHRSSYKLGSRGLEESATGGASTGLDSSTSADHHSSRSEWSLLAATVDRLSFFTYSTVTIVLLACLI